MYFTWGPLTFPNTQHLINTSNSFLVETHRGTDGMLQLFHTKSPAQRSPFLDPLSWACWHEKGLQNELQVKLFIQKSFEIKAVSQTINMETEDTYGHMGSQQAAEVRGDPRSERGPKGFDHSFHQQVLLPIVLHAQT